MYKFLPGTQDNWYLLTGNINCQMKTILQFFLQSLQCFHLQRQLGKCRKGSRKWYRYLIIYSVKDEQTF